MPNSNSLPAEHRAGQAPANGPESCQNVKSVGQVINGIMHDAPSIVASLFPGDAQETDDAGRLLHIVEVQARDLVRLRRALVAARTIAAERLKIINGYGTNFNSSVGKPAPEPEPVPMSETKADADVYAELVRVQMLLEDLLLSRWRKIGQKLRVAKRLPWEAGDWRSSLVAGGDTDQGSATAFGELIRVHRLLEDVLRSRWRKIGQMVGVAARLPWEPNGWRSSLLDPYRLPPEPDSIVQNPKGVVTVPQNVPQPTAPATPQVSEYGSFVEYSTREFLNECMRFGVDAILDVGANVGQFAQVLRGCGYDGHIVSFEPLSDAHGKLEAAAAADPLWDVAERCAVGATPGEAQINLAGNSYSSSLLPMLDLHRDAAPESAYNGSETCQVICLDDYINVTFSDVTTTFGLKIDTQGYEQQVVAGLVRNCHRVPVIIAEISLSPLYEGAPTIGGLCRFLSELNYRCVALAPEFEDPRTGELLQVNGVFVRR